MILTLFEKLLGGRILICSNIFKRGTQNIQLFFLQWHPGIFIKNFLFDIRYLIKFP